MYGCVYCFLNSGIFQYCYGKRKKIRWLKVHITISSFWPQNHNDLIWNWKVLKRPKNQCFYTNTEKNFSVLCQ